jgi:hypothetical protein
MKIAKIIRVSKECLRDKKRAKVVANFLTAKFVYKPFKRLADNLIINYPFAIRHPKKFFSLSKQERKVLFQPWYHDFGIFGIKTSLTAKDFWGSQVIKQGPLFDLIKKAIAICKKSGVSKIAGVELFCADGFYAIFALKNGADSMIGIDLNRERDYLSQATLMAKLLGNSDKIKFELADVFKISGTFDFGICAGGLYHISNPQELLKLLRSKIKTALVIQTVYSLADQSPDYFRTPAPVEGWSWGCRFSYDYLLKMVKDAGWKTIYATTNVLEVNSDPADRGSAYLLCVPENKE